MQIPTWSWGIVRGTWPSLLALVAVVVVAAMPSPATAAPVATRKTPILVLESHTGERPEEIIPLVETLADELEKRGFAAHASTVFRVAAGIPRPGLLDRNMTAAQIAQQVENGYDLFVGGRYPEAVAALQRTIDAIQRNPALVVLNTSNADVVIKAYTTLALSQAKTGDADAGLTMMQVIRMFPTRPFPRADYGPDDEKFFRKVYKQAQAMGRGRLLIAAGNSQAVVFVDGQIRGVDEVELADLVPGSYRVFIQVPGTPGRQYEVEVTANDDSFLNVEPEIDASLWATDSWVGFQFASNAARGKEARFAGEMAARWSGRDLVAVVGTLRLSGRLVLTGTIYTTDGTMLRSAALDVQTATPDLLASLARLMAEGGAPADGLTLIGGTLLGADKRLGSRSRGPWWRRSSPYLIAGTGLLLASTAVYVASPADDYTEPSYTDHRTPAVQAFVASSVIFGGGVYLWLRNERSASRLTAAVLGCGISATLSGVMLFAADEDRHREGEQRPAYRNTAPMGIAVGAVGLAATTGGLLLLLRDRPASIVPIATASGDHGLLGVSGVF